MLQQGVVGLQLLDLLPQRVSLGSEQLEVLQLALQAADDLCI
jgi:hypothetical protein